jgi:hypothetical protein
MKMNVLIEYELNREREKAGIHRIVTFSIIELLCSSASIPLDLSARSSGQLET